MKNTRPNSILVVQVSDVGYMEAKDHFDHRGIERGKHYLFFRVFDEALLAEITPGIPQLVFTSHVPGCIDSIEVAGRIKGINPEAIVFALTSSDVPTRMGMLDGVVRKDLNSDELTGSICNAFLAGKDRSHLIQMIRSFKPKDLEWANWSP